MPILKWKEDMIKQMIRDQRYIANISMKNDEYHIIFFFKAA